MMSEGQGRGSAILGAALVLSLLLVLHSEVAQAATYTVGDAGGWTFNTIGWPRGKSFKAGDILVFNYNPSFHNVVSVNKGGYDNCSTPPRARIYRTGKDRIRLAKGPNFFICNFPGHCQSAMKIAVTAL